MHPAGVIVLGLVLAAGCGDAAGDLITEPDCAGKVHGKARRDRCGVCDSDPSNDCTQDCAGEWGGAATLDACGTCDANPADDCVEDCGGVFGGHAVADACGTCDEDPTNDCVLEE